MMRVNRISKAIAPLLAAALLGGCAAVVEDETGELSSGTSTYVCVDTLECGGFCGNATALDRWFNDCLNTADAGPVGPCFSDCWDPCLFAALDSGHETACTLECIMASCPAVPLTTGLAHIGLAACPAPDSSVLCALDYAPVLCEDCVYSNPCFAAAAGFAPEAHVPVSPTAP